MCVCGSVCVVVLCGGFLCVCVGGVGCSSGETFFKILFFLLVYLDNYQGFHLTSEAKEKTRLSNIR